MVSSFRYAAQTSGLRRGLHVFLNVNQQDGFDCPGCAWPEPGDERATFEFCENGARAIAHEADRRIVGAAFFAAHSIDGLRAQSDHWLEQQGRLAEPVVKHPGAAHYTPITWEDAFSLIANKLHALPSADAAAFYTSGRASNEAAFLYQLFARSFGTNNLPDCSNMCHESSGKALMNTIGVGKGTVQLSDFDVADCIFVMGQNPGTNHPRMLSTLEKAAKRGAHIICVNPLRERALEKFAHPQKALGLLGVGTSIATQWLQVKIGGDVAFLKGMMKVLFEMAKTDDAVLDRAFLRSHCRGVDDVKASVDGVSWDDIVASSGLSREEIERAARSYAQSKNTIACWAMGLTQHKNAVGMIREVVNLLALRGNLGRPGAGVCPVRGHSNVQGDRTMGIYEAPSEAFLARLDLACGIRSPRDAGVDVVQCIEAMEQGRVRAFVALGGNFASATPDTERTARALRSCSLTVQISTKLNRSHLECGDTALILPCLGRTERDTQESGPQFVTVENSMGVVHRSQGKLPPVSAQVKSEPWIVAHLADAVVGDTSTVPWTLLPNNYDRIRDLIERAIAGFANYNARVREPDGFVLHNTARERTWSTASGKVELMAQPLPPPLCKDGEFVLMTIRSHDQFNTTIYENSDRYRGIRNERRVLFIHADDIAAAGFAASDVVNITSVFQGVTREVKQFRLVPYDIPRGCVAAYFPETNPLVPLESTADESNTPTSKSIAVTLQRTAP